MKKILIVTPKQFGYHIDYWKYATYLSEKYEVNFICWDYKLEKINEENIKVVYIQRNKNIIYRNINFIKEIIKVCKNNDFRIIFMNYFKGCSLIRIFLFNKKFRFHIDIRTGSIRERKWKRVFENNLIKSETLFYSSKSVISEGLRKVIGLPEKTIIIPLGANLIPIKKIKTDQFKLLYVGTFYNRNIHETIVGIAKFIETNKQAKIIFDIIGSGDQKTESIIKSAINEYKLEKIINLKGYITHDKLKYYFQEANVGISYIPITEYFQFQPATKTYEYLLAGIPVLATNTYENKKIINESNGLIVNDNSESFAIGLEKLIKNYHNFNLIEIQNSAREFEWKKIIDRIEKLIIQPKLN